MRVTYNVGGVMKDVTRVISHGYFKELYQGQFRSYEDFLGEVDNFLTDEKHIASVQQQLTTGLNVVYIMSLIALMTSDDTRARLMTIWYMGAIKDEPMLPRAMARYIMILVDYRGILSVREAMLNTMVDLCEIPSGSLMAAMCFKKSKLIRKIKGELK